MVRQSMLLIVNADDLGASEAVNDETFALMESGLVTSATLMANGSVVDFSDVFCDLSTCRVELQGEPIYRDDGHLSAAFARKLAPLLSVKLPTPMIQP
jgi:hypothetical protein